MEKCIGIILVNYNGATDTIDCIESLNKMSYKNFQIIVVDNKSTDDSLKLLYQKKDVLKYEVIALNQNRGFSAGNNVGILKAIQNGVKYVLLLNNDTIVDSYFLERLMREEIIASDACVITGTIYYASNKNRIWYAAGQFHPYLAKVSQIGLKYNKAKLPLNPIKVSFASGCCMCIPVSVIEAVGFLDESYFLYEEDVDYCYRLICKNIDIYYVPDAVLYHKISSSTTKTDKMSAVTQYYMVRNKYIFINRYYKGLRRIIPYTHSFLMYFYYCLRYGMEPKYLIWAIVDFLNGKTFKTERKL